MRRFVLVLCSSATFAAGAHARGVSPYLPLNLEPEIERQIERVLILADKPVLTRPIAAATVLDALPRACDVDVVLCQQVRRFLDRYMADAGVGHLSIEGAATSDDANARTIPNRHGLRADSAWQASGQVYWQPFDHALVTLGGVADEFDAEPTGSLVSVGWDRAQLDVGWRTHWLSPFTDSSLLIGSQAPAMPSVTLSNYAPLTRLGLHYELFLARMSRSERIAFQDGFTSGHPKLAGLHLSMEPVSGWALGVNRVMQHGGGARGGVSFGDLLEAFFRPSRADNVGLGPGTTEEEFGNQLASFTSRFLFPGRTPFAVYFEYGGDDTTEGRDYLVGNAALSAGIHFPRLWRRFDLALEISEWQNGLYVHHIYQDGLTHEGRIIGHWGIASRAPGDAVGGHSESLRLGWDPGFGGHLELRYRGVDNEDYTSVAYERAHEIAIRYSRPWRQFLVGAEVYVGKDVFGEDFSRGGLFFRYGDGTVRAGPDFQDVDGTDGLEVAGAEVFVDVGASASKVRIDLADDLPRTTGDASFAPHFAVGVRRAVTERSDLGARVEIGDVDGSLLLAVRAVDYRYRLRGPLALTGFLGAARYDVESPAYGVYLGGGLQWRDLMPGWDLGFDLRYGMKVARDHVLPGEEVFSRDARYYDIFGATLSVSRRF